MQYACRKTLADSRPRVRGRFAKNDEVGETLVKHENKDEDDEEVSNSVCHKSRLALYCPKAVWHGCSERYMCFHLKP